MGLILVFVGGGFGSVCRYAVSLLAVRLGSVTYPFGTLVINILGSFLMGVVAEYFTQKAGLSQPLRLFLTTGIIGGFTTFSTYALETALLWERGEALAALSYVLASTILGVAALFAGLFLVRFGLPAPSLP